MNKRGLYGKVSILNATTTTAIAGAILLADSSHRIFLCFNTKARQKSHPASPWALQIFVVVGVLHYIQVVVRFLYNQ